MNYICDRADECKAVECYHRSPHEKVRYCVTDGNRCLRGGLGKPVQCLPLQQKEWVDHGDHVAKGE